MCDHVCYGKHKKCFVIACLPLPTVDLFVLNAMLGSFICTNSTDKMLCPQRRSLTC